MRESMSWPQHLLLEVADGVLVSIREKVEDVVFDVVLLQVVHQVGTIALRFRPERRQSSRTPKHQSCC